MGTLLAVLLYYARIWLDVARDLLRGRFALLSLLLLATVPAVVAALAFDEWIEGPLREPEVIVVALLAGSAVFVIAERLPRPRRATATWKDAVAIGLAQAVALIPGMSRSGLTISMGLARGLERDVATRMSFLIATPAMFGAGFKTALDARGSGALLFDRPDVLTIGFMVSFLSGLAAVTLLVRFLRTHSLVWFVPYRLALAGVIVAAMAAGAL